MAKKCRYCGEWLDADTEKSMTQKVDSIEPEEASTTVDREEKTSFWRKSWKVLSAILVVILFVGIKVGLKEGGRELVKEAAKAQTTKGDTLSDEAQEVYAFKMLKEGDDYFWYLTDGGDNVYVYDDETSYEDCIRRVEKKIASDNGDEVS